MDPNAALASIREMLGALSHTWPLGKGSEERDLDDLEQIAIKVAELDEWLSKGGFLPAAWQISPILTRDLAPTAAPTLESLSTPEAVAARAERAANSRNGQFGGKEWTDRAPHDPDAERYPRAAAHVWGAFAGLAVEFGGYNDIELVDPYTGRRFWYERAFVDGKEHRSFWDALRATIDAAEAAEFGKREDAELD
jgi:hypothetical protein